MIPLKSTPDDILGRFSREVISDPLNLLIHRVPLAELRLIPLSQVNQYLGLAGRIRNGAGFDSFGRS
jgi:hypothetical protein